MDFAFHLFMISSVTCAALDGPDIVNGSVGQSVHITCTYNKFYSNFQKYWCRGDNWEDCTILVRTQGPRKTNSDGRITIAADNEAGKFSVTMNQLTKNDQGLYWCGIERFLSDILSPVELKVNEGYKLLPSISGDPSGKEILRQNNSLYYFIWSILRWAFFAILLVWALLVKLKI
ncbi:CMRF35-like molecule 7 [Heterodontus francisci]|uniref:CMRF35-like molecule 7 n=1 Tax=Heterodontus francisci TaxID=7792 RepID=UPI00355C34BD